MQTELEQVARAYNRAPLAVRGLLTPLLRLLIMIVNHLEPQ